ncbi:hypothetical protein PIB19_12675 [Sphingomonas sp. 7/4-4]|uniref:hypothetical protein n=1 Tax=Sphingomonas sp. 7/4-4 TaxID=3018446 RepID=UPI0022F3AE80|nr:hypothetical protein [Sphingomonas sp. 7/4-4]WBY06451.1 hypothetical protein PIB19_12675 [Sphingomonas sp. 7/4-4]
MILRVDHADAIEDDEDPDILTVSPPVGAIGCGRCYRVASAATWAGSPRVRAVRYCRMSRCSSHGR